MSKNLNLDEVVSEALLAYSELKNSHIDGAWTASPVEEKDFDLRDFLIRKEGILKKFRRTFLVAGRHNFPDSPRSGFYIEWGLPRAIPLQLRLHGKFKIFLMIIKILFYKRFRLNLKELEDSMIGGVVPQNIFGYKITDSQIRNFYYREEILKNIGDTHTRVLEIGGGFGGLSGELLKNSKIEKYYFVDLFDALPLAYFYLSVLLKDEKIQILTSADQDIDDEARVIILPPQLMSKITSEISLFINTMSFQHMSGESVNFYLQEASRLKSKYIFLNNRDWKRDPTDLKISEYPIPDGYQQIIKKKWLFGKQTLAIYKN